MKNSKFEYSSRIKPKKKKRFILTDFGIMDTIRNTKNAITGGATLKEFIKRVRATKTSGQEKDVITKECAFIRTSFKSDNTAHIHKNIAKLLFIHMMGYPAHFGQMECIKLIASQKYSDKRIGYLALMLLMDESQELLMLVTNSLKNDINNKNQYIAGLALCCIGNIGTEDMAHDLSNDILKLLNSSNAYLRKRAALVAIRLFVKAPELLEDEQVNYYYKVLNDTHDSVLMTGIHMLLNIVESAPNMLERYREKCIPKLCKHLKRLMEAPFSYHYDVNGICNPFLQVQILNIFRVLAKGNKEASSRLNDTLNEYIVFLSKSNNSTAEAVLYEAVRTIMAIPSSKQLKTNAINVLGNFLLIGNNNAKYVALNTLLEVTDIDISLVLPLQSVIITSMGDSDVSIQKTALDLGYAIVNKENYKVMVIEMINSLVYIIYIINSFFLFSLLFFISFSFFLFLSFSFFSILFLSFLFLYLFLLFIYYYIVLIGR